MGAKQCFRGWTSLGWSSHLEGSMKKHLGSSMRPPFVLLVCSLQHMEEHTFVPLVCGLQHVEERLKVIIC